MNTNVCYQFNFDAVLQEKDPGNMIAWLEQELDALEKVGGQAIMIAHVPNGKECNRQFGRRYHALMDRY